MRVRRARWRTASSSALANCSGGSSNRTATELFGAGVIVLFIATKYTGTGPASRGAGSVWPACAGSAARLWRLGSRTDPPGRAPAVPAGSSGGAAGRACAPLSYAGRMKRAAPYVGRKKSTRYEAWRRFSYAVRKKSEWSRSSDGPNARLIPATYETDDSQVFRAPCASTSYAERKTSPTRSAATRPTRRRRATERASRAAARAGATDPALQAAARAGATNGSRTGHEHPTRSVCLVGEVGFEPTRPLRDTGS